MKSLPAFVVSPALISTQNVSLMENSLLTSVILCLPADILRSRCGVLSPECFDAVPFLALLAEYGAPHGFEERVPHLLAGSGPAA